MAFFGDRRKEPDRTVQIIGTAVQSEKYSPVSSMKMETVKGTGLYGLALWDRNPVQSIEIVGPNRTVQS